jgi:hypothetical protein
MLSVVTTNAFAQEKQENKTATLAGFQVTHILASRGEPAVFATIDVIQVMCTGKLQLTESNLPFHQHSCPHS